MRKLKLLTKYKHFKEKEYMVLGVSTPISEEFSFAIVADQIMPVIHTEKESFINVLITTDYKDTMYRHFKSDWDGNLVIYMALYDDFKIYVRPYDMFMSLVDKEKYPNIKQKYRFEEI